jgi:hypothetical protein
MAVWDSIKDRFQGKKNIEKITKDELRLEKIRLDQEEKKLVQRVDELEKEKRKLFDEGVKESSERKQVIIARKIKELDSQADHYDRQLRSVAHQIRVMNGLLMIKEQVGVSNDKRALVSRIPIEKLALYVEKSTVKGEFAQDRIQDILQTVEEGGDIIAGMDRGEEEDVKQIVSIFQTAKASGEAPEASMKKVEEVLGKKRETEEKE